MRIREIEWLVGNSSVQTTSWSPRTIAIQSYSASRTSKKKWVNWICGSFKQLVNPLYTLNVGLCKVYTAFEESMQTEKNVTIPLAAHKTASAMFQICMRESHNIRIESNKDRAKVALPVPNRNLKTNRINDPLCPLPAIDHQSESSLARLL